MKACTWPVVYAAESSSLEYVKFIFALSKLKLSCYFPCSLSIGAQHAVKQLCHSISLKLRARRLHRLHRILCADLEMNGSGQNRIAVAFLLLEFEGNPVRFEH